MKTAVVTGGTRGIGKAISLHLARQGVQVFALYARNRKAAEELEVIGRNENLPIKTLRGDLTDEDKLEELLTEIKAATPTLDILVHAAASGVHNTAMELSEKHLKWTFNVNVFSVHNLIRGLAPMFTQGSRVVGITSSGGTHVIPYYAAVGSSKGALESLFRHYAVEFAPKGVAVNLVCPGMVMTDAVEAFPEKEKRIDKCITGTPTGKMVTTEEVAEMVGFLTLNSAGQSIIGQTFIIDGGKCLMS
jgi:enoyl-[acyl-carrier protein] reductase III